MTHPNPQDTARNNVLAAALALQQVTRTAANIIPVPGTDSVIAIGTREWIARNVGTAPAGAEAQAAVPEGFVLVPAEPTAAMLIAGAESEDKDFGLIIRNVYRAIIAAAPEGATTAEAHPDDIAVDRFAAAMKAKMAASRAKGRNGWDNEALCPADRLRTMLADHLAKGDPVDVGNFAMMLWNRGERTAAQAQAADVARIFTEGQMRQIILMVIDYCAWQHGNGFEVPVDVIIAGVLAGKPADADGPGGYGYANTVHEWKRAAMSAPATSKGSEG